MTNTHIFHPDFDLDRPCVVTIGNFDGLHVGHQALIQSVLETASQIGGHSALVTFDPHPQEVLNPNQPLPKICTPALQKRLWEESGLDLVSVIPFTPEFANLSPEEFVYHFLMEPFQLNKVIVGDDFHFGKKRAGNFDLLQEMGQAAGFDTSEIAMVEVNGTIASSTQIRKHLQAGQILEASELLGRPYSLYGEVIQGDQRGRTIGFPTANMNPEVCVPLKYGVYAVEVMIGHQSYQGVMNFGVRPTFSKSTPLVEVNIFDFSEDIYGQMMEVWPLHQIRTEQKFDGLEALKQQIAKDVEASKAYLAQELKATMSL